MTREYVAAASETPCPASPPDVKVVRAILRIAVQRTMRRKISDVLRQRALVDLPATASVQDATELMCESNVGSVLIMEQGRLTGIFTERDLVCRVVAVGREPRTTVLRDVMTARPDTIAPSALALDGLHMMTDGGYRHLPVVAGGKVIGVISRRDFFGLEQAQFEDEETIWQRI